MINREAWIVCDQERMWIEEYSSEAEALEIAREAIQAYRGPDGWNEGADGVMVAKITHRSKEIWVPIPPEVPIYRTRASTVRRRGLRGGGDDN